MPSHSGSKDVELTAVLVKEIAAASVQAMLLRLLPAGGPAEQTPDSPLWWPGHLGSLRFLLPALLPHLLLGRVPLPPPIRPAAAVGNAGAAGLCLLGAVFRSCRSMGVLIQGPPC